MKAPFLLLLAFYLALPVFSQEQPKPLTQEEKTEVIDSLSAIIDRTYVFPDVAKAIADHLQKRTSEGAYQDIVNPARFSEILSEDIRAINDDRHLRVQFEPELIAEFQQVVSPEDSLAFAERQRQQARMDNYGFKEVKLLDGNIGYLQFNAFYEVDEEAGQVAQAAMNFLSNADALIIDLRRNGGGSPSMIQLISSYLFDSRPVHLNTFFWRPYDEYTQTWTLPYVPGKRRPDQDVYVLTSQNTFSAAEEFTYNLRNLERATIVGEVTGGGAHPGGIQIASDRFTVFIPSGRAINPITKTNWEGTGVEPHIKVPATDALLVAHTEALKKRMEASSGPQKFQYQWALDGLNAKKSAVTPDAKLLQTYAGTYGPRTLSYENGHLYYQREGNPKYLLIPMTDNLFMIEDLPFFRLQVDLEEGKPVSLTGLYDNGQSDLSLRDKK